MTISFRLPRPGAALRVLGGLALGVLTACAGPDGGRPGDPLEPQNRAVHRFNVALDRSVVAPASEAYGTGVPSPVRRSVDNFAGNLDLPGMVLNDLVQLRPEDALVNASRFLLNSTFGLVGLFDPADSIGLSARDTDFGETLHVLGFGRGAYLELPVLGPSTVRDTLGTVVDIAANPVRVALPPEARTAGAVAGVGAGLNQRFRFGDFLDEMLYESADSYAQARQMYLENRRFELGDGADPDYFNPYEDPYGR